MNSCGHRCNQGPKNKIYLSVWMDKVYCDFNYSNLSNIQKY